MAHRGEAVPLTVYQRTLLATLATAPTDDRYLAGGAAMHFAPTSTRFSDDLDFFHESEARVASAFAADRLTLQHAGHAVDVELSLPGFVRAVVHRGEHATRVDWAHDSAWRFMPLVRDELGGLLLHPVDLAVNKVLALADAETFVRVRPPEESGCLYFSMRQLQFVVPRHDASLPNQEIVPHFGAPGGVLPRMADSRIEGS